MVRLQKFLADAGIASRRASEEIIVAGRVEVNGKPIRILGTKIDPARDNVVVDGSPIKAKKKLYLALHKPRGYLCSRKDERERRTLSDLLPKEWSNVYSVGRLDFDSEGLIFLTNDGQFSLQLTHPRYGIRKKYRATVMGKVTHDMLKKITHGVEHEGETLKAETARVVDASQSHSVVELVLAEGKYREVRRLFESQGVEVERLQRTQIGPIKLGELPLGKWRTLTETEIKSLIPKL
jgi:23S rRNA pseudouridine2605 synthase